MLGSLARGLSNKAIAEQLVISPKTAGNHIEHIYAKIGASQPGDGEPVRDAARPPPGGGVRGRRADVIHARCIASMFCCMASLTWFSSSVGLNCTYSVPASTLGMWPAGR